MSKLKAISVIVHETEPEQIGKVLLAFGEMQQIHGRLKIFFQAAQGGCLLRLQEAYGFTRGHHGTKTATCGFSSWSEFIKSKFGFSDDKALRLINQFKATIPLIEKLKPAEQQLVADFLRRPMLHLNPAEVAALEKVTTRIATLQDEIDEAGEAKFLKRPRTSKHLNPPGRELGSKNVPVPIDQENKDQLLLPLGIEKGDGSRKAIWSQFDELYEAWTGEVKIGNSKVPRWQTLDSKTRQQVITEIEKQKAIITKKLDDMLAQAKEVVRK